jgi:hypothetical protein
MNVLLPYQPFSTNIIITEHGIAEQNVHEVFPAELVAAESTL